MEKIPSAIKKQIKIDSPGLEKHVKYALKNDVQSVIISFDQYLAEPSMLYNDIWYILSKGLAVVILDTQEITNENKKKKH